MRSTISAVFYLVGAAAAALAPAQAQTYPAKSVTLVSGASIGSGPDVAVRSVVTRISEAFGQPIVVDPRRGAGGMDAYRAGARAAPDGYLMTFANAGVITNRFLRENWPIDAVKEYTPVLQVLDTAFMVGAHSSLPANNLPDLIEYAKRNPGKVNYASTGVGSGAHLVGESLAIMAGVKMTHIPYTGQNSAMALTDLLSNRVQIYFASANTFDQYVEPGKLKMLAYVNGRRDRSRPNIATVNETLPNYYNLVIWFGILGPANLPRPIVDRWYAEGRKALGDPAITGKFDALGVIPALEVTPDDFARRIRSDFENIGKVVNAIGLKPE